MVMARPMTAESPAKCACHPLYVRTIVGCASIPRSSSGSNVRPSIGPEAQHREVVRGRVIDPDAVGAAIRVELDDSARVRHERGEHRRVGTVVAEVGVRELVRLRQSLFGSSEDDEIRAVPPGSGLNSRLSTTLYIAPVTPMPNANVSATTATSPGLRRSARMATRTSPRRSLARCARRSLAACRSSMLRRVRRARSTSPNSRSACARAADALDSRGTQLLGARVDVERQLGIDVGGDVRRARSADSDATFECRRQPCAAHGRLNGGVNDLGDRAGVAVPARAAGAELLLGPWP